MAVNRAEEIADLVGDTVARLIIDQCVPRTLITDLVEAANRAADIALSSTQRVARVECPAVTFVAMADLGPVHGIVEVLAEVRGLPVARARFDVERVGGGS